MKGEQSSPRRRSPESVPEVVALFRAADPREEVADRRLEAVFTDVEMLVHEEIAIGGELGGGLGPPLFLVCKNPKKRFQIGVRWKEFIAKQTDPGRLPNHSICLARGLYHGGVLTFHLLLYT